jgi:transcriptional regulator GlxA family with amidase domain
VYGVTPYAFLLRKRISAARRLLAGTDLAVTEVAEQCGFGTRFTLFRQLRAAGGDNSRALRGRADAGAILWSDATSESRPSATVARN